MKKLKRLKDPIYGYIDIPTKYMTRIVDTPSFQRLRRIIQTSYSPLYSCAVHNRFVHSIGVYHLGEMAFQSLENEIKNKFEVSFDLARCKEIFLLACLLHDVGHAPFSHTGEGLYLDENKEYTLLHKELVKIVESKCFSKDIPIDRSKAAAPHEIMSAIVGLKEYYCLFMQEDEREFFARCITGYKYSAVDKEKSFKNCFISLLNSKVIDVDKLDYLIRDAFITGFDTVNIDFERLLTSLTVTETDEGLELGYYKNAVSVIENVVYAHDSERKWIQNHPIVLYESYILKHTMSYISTKMDSQKRKLFSLKSLANEGQNFGKNLSIKLLCDDDIIYLMKNVYPCDLSEEFFDRNKRRHPIWKLEAEYKAFFLNITAVGELLTRFERAMEITANYLVQNTDSWVIDKKLIEKIQKEVNEIKEKDLNQKTKEVQIKEKGDILKIIKCLSEYADEKKIECDFTILMASQFNSGFSKPDFSATNIIFKTKDGDRVAKFDIASSIKAKDKARDNFFYIFYKRKDDENADIDNTEICQRLFLEFLK